MKIVILCLSPSRGGLELYALEEIRQLTERGHECLAVVAKGGYLAEVLAEEGRAHFLLDVKNRRLPLIASGVLAQQMDTFGAELLHMHWGDDLNLAVLAKVRCQKKPALVYTRHMNYTRNKKDFLHRWFYQRVDLMLVGTKLLQQLAQKFLPMDKSAIKLLYIGVSEPEQDTNCDTLFDKYFPRRKLNLAVFGRIENGKGQHVLIEAVQNLIQRHCDISLSMIGHTMDAGYQSALEQKIKQQDMGEHIRFKGFIANATNKMRCFDVVVLTTLCETFGLVLVEAMRAGVAVIGTNAGGVPEIIEDEISGLLVQPGDTSSMQNKIERFYNDDELIIKLASAGKQRADEIFSSEFHYNALDHEMQKLIQHNA